MPLIFLVSEVTHVPRWGILSVCMLGGVGEIGKQHLFLLQTWWGQTPHKYSGETEAPAKGRHPGSLCSSGRQGCWLHTTGLEARPGEGQVTGASSPAASPSVLDRSPYPPRTPGLLQGVLSGSGFG